MVEHRYTKEQMQKAFDAGYSNADDSYPGPDFDEFLVTLTPEPSADVVEGAPEALAAYYPFDALLRANGVESEAEKMVIAQVAVHGLTKFFAPIIEAEVQRRMAQPAAKPHQHDPDDRPERGMEDKR